VLVLVADDITESLDQHESFKFGVRDRLFYQPAMLAK
jgi:hypothetical protein